jgi:hypothetical protein
MFPNKLTLVTISMMLGTMATPAFASDADPRIYDLALKLDMPVLRSTSSAPARAWLPAGGQYGPAMTHERARYANVGPVTLAIRAVRMASISIIQGDVIRSPDRFSVKAVGVDAGLDIASGLSLRTFATATRMRRRLGVAADRARSIGTTAATIGMGIERAGLAALTLDYDRTRANGHRRTLDDMVEQSGGTPIGQGFRLTLANATAGLMAGRVAWSLSAMALQRSNPTSTSFALDRATMDRRAEASVRFTF